MINEKQKEYSIKNFGKLLNSKETNEIMRNWKKEAEEVCKCKAKTIFVNKGVLYAIMKNGKNIKKKIYELKDEVKLLQSAAAGRKSNYA
jgi:hypothetical protein